MDSITTIIVGTVYLKIKCTINLKQILYRMHGFFKNIYIYYRQ